MKRPEGFDPPGRQQQPPPGRKPVQPPRSGRPPKSSPVRAPQPPSPRAPVRFPAAQATKPDPDARKDLKRSARNRRKFERAEVRRFTRRARNRRLAIGAIVGVLVTLAALVVTAVYSPILALRTITIEGTSRVSADQVMAAVDDQMGTPLALIDYGKITSQLGAFPLIRSYVTETVPPSTLIIHVVERTPVGAISSGSTFQLVDPAGVVVQESSERVAGIPLIDIGGAATSSTAFDSVVEVLVSLPPELLAQVDSASAQTHDDVTLVLTGVGQRVIWGSATDSAAKAKLLAALIAVTNPNRAGSFDVSAPTNGVFRPA